MEIRRIISCLASVLLIVATLLVCLQSDTWAWDNQTVHPQVNRSALELFQTIKNTDPYLRNASLDGGASWGRAWDIADGIDLFHQSVSVRRQKTAQDWIIMGGFSADEPEGPMALRHFYNPYPPNNPAPWLTDQQQIVNFLNSRVSSTIRNPEISIIDWAEDLEKDRVDDYFLSQDYSWNDAKDWFKKALESAEPYNENYGKAWRAVGETMHLVADLTLPPHVRNDGHATYLRNGDPLETTATDEHVRRYYSAAGGWSPAINYNQDIIRMMRQVAQWTNTNFLSRDTIPLNGRTTTANGFPAFPSPTWVGRTPDNNGYIWYEVDGNRIRMARTSAWYRWGLSNDPGYIIDDVVARDQFSLVLPTAVRASEAVIERFLPRFRVEVQVTPDKNILGRYQVHGSLIQGQDNVTSYEWQRYGRLVVRNGARIIVNNKEIIPVTVLTSEEELNEFTRDISADAGASIVVSYDLGGYVIQSKPITQTIMFVFRETTKNLIGLNVLRDGVEIYHTLATGGGDVGVLLNPGEYTARFIYMYGGREQTKDMPFEVVPGGENILVFQLP